MLPKHSFRSSRGVLVSRLLLKVARKFQTSKVWVWGGNFQKRVCKLLTTCDENGKNKVEKEWPADKSKIEGSIKEKIEDSINKYRDNYTLNQEYKGNEPRQEDEQEQIYNDKLSNNDELNNQAVLVEDTPLFYIRAWNNG